MLLVYCPIVTERIRYIFKHIFFSILGIEVNFTNNIEKFIQHSGPKLSYAKEALGNELFYQSHGLLSEKGIREDVEIHINYINEVPYFFEIEDSTSAKSYDLFASSFYLITRYEEYLPSITDSLGRFEAKNSLAYQNGFLKMPVVDLWARELFLDLKAVFPDVQLKQRPFAYINTINVHEAYKYKNRGFLRNILRLGYNLFRLDLQEFYTAFKVLINSVPDPYDTFDFLLELHRTKKLRSIFFFSIGENSPYDFNIQADKQPYRELIKSIEDYAFVGLNYSYQSIEKPQLKKSEKRQFEEICNRLPNRVRQHKFKLIFPYTYREIYANDILKDFSMGYHNEIGFRASTCTPFFFYDVKYENLTLLKLFPFVYTDLALKLKFNHDRKKIRQELMSLIMIVKEYSGVFISVFENTTFARNTRWKGWREIYIESLETIESMTVKD